MMGQSDSEQIDASGVRAWWAVIRRTWARAGEDNLGLIAAAIAFNAFLALVPLLTAAVLSYGIFASAEQLAEHIAALARALPEQAVEILGDQLRDMTESSGTTSGIGLAVALGIAVFSALRGASGVMTALNLVFDVKETRGFVHRTAVALAITVGLVLLFIIASLGISLVNLLGRLLPDLGGFTQDVLGAAFWLVAAAAMNLVVAQIYVIAPDRPLRWRWFTPGSVAATLLWIAASLGFSVYVGNFGSYNATYGALGAVIVFLTWLYLSAFTLLLGAELNNVLQADAEPA